MNVNSNSLDSLPKDLEIARNVCSDNTQQALILANSLIAVGAGSVSSIAYSEAVRHSATSVANALLEKGADPSFTTGSLHSCTITRN